MKKEELIRNLKNQGFSDNIIEAFTKVKREDFIPKELKSLAYEDTALPIGFEQTISQPYTIAFMLRLLEIKDNQSILEIGSGSGYVLALISKLAKNLKIYGIERIKRIAEKSQEILKDNKNIKIIHADGSNGLLNYSPYDRILFSAALDEIPYKLNKQLKFKGILVAPVKDSIICMKKEVGENKITQFPGFVFVPVLKGKES
jgi:protein-L-isoaspartate(D-aspartate) O-methyltransferase